MPNWNGQTVSSEAHRIALQIESQTGRSTLPDSFPVAGDLRTNLRRLYSATGGHRGDIARDPSVYNPSSSELREVYNGQRTGAEIHASVRGTTTTTTETPAVVIDAGPDAKALEALKTILGGQKVDPEAVKAIAVAAVDGRIGDVMTSMDALIAEQVAKQVRTVEVKVADLPAVKFDATHKDFERVMRFVANKQNIMLVGPAGCGKTKMAEQIAEALGKDYYLSGKCNDEVKITGYMDGGGTYRSTAFRKAYEFGGLFLFDEIDGWSPDALIAVNAPLAGEIGDFPDGQIKRHPDFVAIAAANTFGRGADREYVAREQLDAATLDRFAVVEIGYDEDLERAISCNAEWTAYVQKVRAAVEGEKVRHVVSPRASIGGGIMLAAGMSRGEVEESYVWKGMEERVRNQVKAAMR